MNPQEFFRQAQFMRDYVPTITPDAGTTINTLEIYYARYIVVGTMVMGMLGITFNISNTNSARLDIGTPTKISGESTAIFFGESEQATIAYGANLTQIGDRRHIRIKKQNGTNFGINSINFPVVRIAGFFCYENGERETT